MFRATLLPLLLLNAACSTSPNIGANTTSAGSSGATGSTGGIATGTTSGSGSTAGSTSGSLGGTTGAPDAGSSLIGIWDVTTTTSDGTQTQATVTIGQNQMILAWPSFDYTLQKTNGVLQSVLANDEDVGGEVDVASTPSAGAFDAGILPYDLGGSWTIVGGLDGGTPTVSCNLQIAAGQVNATCNDASTESDVFAWSFTSALAPHAQAQPSDFGDFSGAWNNTWTYPTDNTSYPCAVSFSGSTISTCQTGDSPLAQVTFTVNGSTVSGSAKGAEFTATKR